MEEWASSESLAFPSHHFSLLFFFPHHAAVNAAIAVVICMVKLFFFFFLLYFFGSFVSQLWLGRAYHSNGRFYVQYGTGTSNLKEEQSTSTAVPG